MSDAETETTFELTSKGLVTILVTRERGEEFRRVKVDISQFTIYDMVCHKGKEARDDKFEVDDKELIGANELHSFYPEYLSDDFDSVQAAIKNNRYRLVSRGIYDVGELSETEVDPFDSEKYGITSVDGDLVRFVSLKEGKIA